MRDLRDSVTSRATVLPMGVWKAKNHQLLRGRILACLTTLGSSALHGKMPPSPARSLVASSAEVLAVLAVLAACVAAPRAPAMDASKLAPPAQVQIVFSRDIKPILTNTCYRCHSGDRPKSHFLLTSRATALKGRRRGGGHPAGSERQEPAGLLCLAAGAGHGDAAGGERQAADPGANRVAAGLD